MGLLDTGTAFHWTEAKKYADHVRHHGIIQFLNIWNHSSQRTGDPWTWGDEIEYAVVAVDEERRTARLSIRQEETLEELSVERIEEDEDLHEDGIATPTFHPECGRFMLESVPGEPYGPTLSDLLNVERNMAHRRRLAKAKLRSHEIPLTIASFPRLGAGGQFLEPHHEPNGPISNSLFLPDELMNPHVRYSALLTNIRERRGSKVDIHIPVFHDVNTPAPFLDPTVILPSSSPSPLRPDHIYLDATGFGTGCCCLQATLQASSFTEATRMYDAMVPLTPILLALAAAAPVFKGFLADVDNRWGVLMGAADDRTEEERGLKPLKDSRFRMPKSPYEGVSLYISSQGQVERYNDVQVPFDADIERRLTEEGVDEPLARHLAHLFIRDPLLILSEKLDQDDEQESAHFDNIQSTNWSSLRFKPPPPNSNLGCRTEFRTLDVQLTDFENAAYAIFLVLVVRALLSSPSECNFYVPISKVDDNMERAQRRDAARKGRLWWRKDVFAATGGPVEEEYGEMSMDEIVNGDEEKPGLMGLVTKYLDESGCDGETREKLDVYLDLISGRASGRYVTAATYIRNFIHEHPAYKQDSVVSSEITYDLVVAIDEIERGVRPAPELLGPHYRHFVHTRPASPTSTPPRSPSPVKSFPTPAADFLESLKPTKSTKIDDTEVAKPIVRVATDGKNWAGIVLWKLFTVVSAALFAAF